MIANIYLLVGFARSEQINMKLISPFFWGLTEYKHKRSFTLLFKRLSICFLSAFKSDKTLNLN